MLIDIYKTFSYSTETDCKNITNELKTYTWGIINKIR